ncbi:MAG: SGNH/GDSL hydrolase family protein [Isosphaeraceae bacterium]|nr:SGNH/GDSL hydrolase family protein [Isosphaeraceae bacterium]
MLPGCSGLLALVILVTPLSTALGGVLDGIGVMGDSYSDEYQFYPVDRSLARNWVEILAEAHGLNFGKFSTASRGEPRNQGYEFNWSRSEATTDDLIASGQHTGLAAQVARGEVTLACVFIGGNDFIHALKSPEPARALGDALPRAVKNFHTAVSAVLAASPNVKVVLGTLPDIRDLPEIADSIRVGLLDLSLADAYTKAIDEFNAQVRAIGLRDRRVAVMDLAVGMKVANRLGRDALVVAGQKLDRHDPGNGLGHVFLADRRHLGTLGHGAIARFFIVTVNLRFRAGIPPLTDQALLSCAGASLADGSKSPGLTELVNRTGGRDIRVSPPNAK